MAALSPVQSCAPATFSSVALFGAEILQVEASVVTNYDFDIPDGWRYSQPAIDVQNATFCNVTVTYTHPGQNDTVITETWLPVSDWNGRLQSIGGGGWVAGRFYLTYAGMAGAIHDGFASATTDGGVGDASSPALWGLVSPGNLDLVDLDNLGQRSLEDLVSILSGHNSQHSRSDLAHSRLSFRSSTSTTTLDRDHRTPTGTPVLRAADSPRRLPNNSQQRTMASLLPHQHSIGPSLRSVPAGRRSTWISRNSTPVTANSTILPHKQLPCATDLTVS